MTRLWLQLFRPFFWSWPAFLIFFSAAIAHSFEAFIDGLSVAPDMFWV